MGITTDSLYFLLPQQWNYIPLDFLPESFEPNLISFQPDLSLLLAGSKDSKVFLYHFESDQSYRFELPGASPISALSLNAFPLYIFAANITRSVRMG